MKRSQDLKDLRDKTPSELNAEIAQAKADLFKFRTDMAMRSLANVKSIRSTRKRIARIHTLVTERELAGNEAQK